MEQQIRAPFEVQPTPDYQQGLVFHNNAWKTPSQTVTESNAQAAILPVEEKFPVSSGIEHQKQEEVNDAQGASESINVFAKHQVGLFIQVSGMYTCDVPPYY